MVTALLLGCQEYDLAAPEGPVAVSNPVELGSRVQHDTILQTAVPLADVLWVIDDSCSMEDEQQYLTEAFPYFMQFFVDSGLDYHVGVVSTDMSDRIHAGKLRTIGGARWVDETASDPITLFGSMARLGTRGSGREEGRNAAYTALEVYGDTANAGFVRSEEDGGSVHVIVMTDEDDSSSTTAIGVEDFGTYLNGLRQRDEEVSFSAMCTVTRCVQYIAVTEQVGGVIRDIARDPWGDVLTDLGAQASGYHHEFFLSELPVVDSLEVVVEKETHTMIPFQLDRDFTYDEVRNSVTFRTYVVGPLSRVHVTYTVRSTLMSPE
ncbi:MAG: hypothetical protein H6735_28365 [Alphaproteobacteria bacterium]|nr:hypothetical protein [Alphaproteobacteria bacterium]